MSVSNSFYLIHYLPVLAFEKLHTLVKKSSNEIVVVSNSFIIDFGS